MTVRVPAGIPAGGVLHGKMSRIKAIGDEESKSSDERVNCRWSVQRDLIAPLVEPDDDVLSLYLRFALPLPEPAKP